MTGWKKLMILKHSIFLEINSIFDYWGKFYLEVQGEMPQLRRDFIGQPSIYMHL